MTRLPRLGILISGRGSNMTAIMDHVSAGRLAAEVAVVFSNRSDAKGLVSAQAAGVSTVVRSPSDYPDRAAYEAELVTVMQDHDVDWVILAGYMKLLGAPLLDAFPGHVLNVHPSLLPAFKGLNAQKQALDYGVKVSGCTVHFVTEDMDAGPIILQTAVPVLPTDDEPALSARILVAEHALYSQAIGQVIRQG